jgi:hypothetical protein
MLGTHTRACAAGGDAGLRDPRERFPTLVLGYANTET